MTRRLPLAFLILFELICIQIAAGRPPPYNGQTFGPPMPLSFDNAVNFQDFTGGPINTSFNSSPAVSFSDILFGKLVENNKFRSIFSRQINADQVMNLGIAISQALKAQSSIKDPYFATSQMLNALLATSPTAGYQAFARAIANAMTLILQSNGVLTAGNDLFFANSLSSVIINAAASVYGDVDIGIGANIGVNSGIGLGTQVGAPINLNERNLLGVANGVNALVGGNVNNFNNGKDIDIDLEDWFDDIDFDADIDIDTNLGLGANVGAGLGISTDTRADVGTKLEAGIDLGTKTGFGLGIDTLGGLGTKVRTGADLGSKNIAGIGIVNRAGVGSKIGTAIDLGANTGAGLDVSKRVGVRAKDGTDVDLGAKIGAGVDLGSKIGAGVDLGTKFGAGVDLGTKVGAGVGLGAQVGADVNLGAKEGASLGLDVDASVSTDLEVGASLNVGADKGVGIDTEITSDFNNVFKTELMKELLRNKYFRYIFSDYVPMPVLNQVIAAIAQYLTKAFSVPRSAFLPLEKNILILSTNNTPTLQSYADAIANTICVILSDLNIITPISVRLQIIMAANAISSGISNFLDISATPGLGLSPTSNSYNSLFSVLSGLEKLPYVGAGAVARKLSPILETARASSFALQFVKELYNNLVSSRRFYESFSLGVPTSSYKIISNSLANFMAEAFGSPNSSIFADIYANALLRTIGNLNYAVYAKTLSLATTRALYLLGYFTARNVNIQAAIATNAILRSLKKQFQQKPAITQVALLPEVLGIYGLPWTMQLAGVVPSNSILKVRDGVGLDIAAKTKAGAALDASIGVNTKSGLGTSADVEANSGIKFDADGDLDADFAFDLELDEEIGLELTSRKVKRESVVGDESNKSTGLDAGEDINSGSDALKRILRRKRDLFSDVDLDSVIDNNASLDLDISSKLEATGELGLGTNLKAGVDAGVGIGAGLNAGVGLGIGLDAGLALGTGSGIGVDVGLGKNSDGNTPGTKLSVLSLLPKILADKFYKSTALYTSVSIAGPRKVVNLIAQSIAVQFGFPVASVFLKSYDKSIANNLENYFVSSMIALADATTKALAEIGILNSNFTVLKVNQLAKALVAKYSSLIATSLEIRERNINSKWVQFYDQDVSDPSLLPCYG